MADNRSIVITLKIENDGSSGITSPASVSSTSSTKGTKSSAGVALAAWAVSQAVQTTVSELVAWGEYNWNKELTLNDDYIGQRNKQIALTQINRGISAVGSIFSSTASGAAVGGVAGAIIGFVVGTATQVANITRGNLQAQEQQDIRLRQMEAQLDFTRSRAGWSLKAASIGEDL